jgi:hypothetical protein
MNPVCREPLFIEKVSTPDWFFGRISDRGISGLGLAVVLTAALFSTGCHKSKPQAVQTSLDQNTNPVAVQPPVPVYEQPSTASQSAAAQPSAAPDLKELNRNLLRWILGNRRRPQNFEEFAATANVPIPPPPAGKKYVLGKDMHIQLVDR